MIEPVVLANPVNKDPEQLVLFLRVWLGDSFISSLCNEYNRSIKFDLTLSGLHPFTKGFRALDLFRKTGKTKPEYFQLVEYARRIRIFANEWNNSSYSEDFWKVIRDKKRCLEQMFVLQVGVHFLNAGYPVSLILDNRGANKKLDLIIHHPKQLVGVECTRRKINGSYWDSIGYLADDLLHIIEGKAEGGYDYKLPRLLWIQTPIDVPIFHDAFREEMGNRILGRFTKDERYGSISLALICSDDKFTELALPNNKTYYFNKPTNLGWWNPNDRYKLVENCPDLKVSLSF